MNHDEKMTRFAQAGLLVRNEGNGFDRTELAENWDNWRANIKRLDFGSPDPYAPRDAIDLVNRARALLLDNPNEGHPAHYNALLILAQAEDALVDLAEGE